MNRRLVGLIGLGLAAATPVWAQADSTRAVPDSVTVIADSTVGRGRLGRWLLGSHYRDLWVTPIRVEVLDLDVFAGGLTPLIRGGGSQTRSLHFRGGDGRQYVFRLMRKDPEPIVRRLRARLVAGLIRDGMSAMLPGGVLVVPPLLEAAGVLQATPLLRYLPDTPRLAAFRADFGNQLGTIEERPIATAGGTSGLAGARWIEDTPRMLALLQARPSVQVDTRAFLTVRLLDLYFGDWDRHDDQWKWALRDSSDAVKWQPIPRDRDQAFVRYDGVLAGVVRLFVPQLLSFSEDYPSPGAATISGRSLDLRFLTGLPWPVWDSIARTLQTRLTDQVIDRAVDRLPAEYEARSGAVLRQTLRVRRDKLPQMAQEYFRFLQGVGGAGRRAVERADGRARGQADSNYIRTQGTLLLIREAVRPPACPPARLSSACRPPVHCPSLWFCLILT